MKAAVMQAPLKMTLEEWDVPVPGPGEALVKVMAVGICGSDIHYYEHGGIGDYVVKPPFVLGHECSGIVAALGENVTRLKVGDRVAIEPGATCGKCSACKSGRYNLCPHVRFLATPPIDGAFAQYIVMPEDLLFPIPDHLSFEEAALNEPFSVGIQAAKRAGMQPGSSIVITGMGPVGLMSVIAAKAFGASTIIVSDVEESRLNAARSFGATHTVQVKTQSVRDVVMEITNQEGADYAFEASGNPQALRDALASLKRGGKLSIIGLPTQLDVPLNILTIADREIDIHGVFRYANTYPQGIAFLASGQFPVKNLITDRYDLDHAHEAMERARLNKSQCLKVMVYPNGMN
jgi:L-iditol 2-dehydrogenase